MSTTLELAVPADLSGARTLHLRLNAALADLGLTEALPTRWVTPARSGFYFAPHNLHQAARLVDALERLGSAVAEAGVDVHGHSGAVASEGTPVHHRAGSPTDGVTN